MGDDQIELFDFNQLDELESDGNVLGLLAFYREKIANFDKERQEIIDRVATTEVAHAELHRVKWELRVRQEEIAELQNALSDANVQLFEEREESLKLLAENDQLKVQQVEDRRRIQHLLALTEPVSQEVTFFKDCRPYIMTRKLHSSSKGPSKNNSNQDGECEDVRISGNDNVQLGQSANTARLGSSRASSTSQSKVLRTIYLPNERTDSLTMRVQSLERQLEDQAKNCKDRVQAMEKDRVERESLYRKNKAALTKQVEALEQKLDFAEKSTRAATKDYLYARQQNQQQERDFHEQMAATKAENSAIRLELNTLSEKLRQETQAVRTSVIEDGERYVQRFRSQALEREENFNKLKHKHEKYSAEAEEKISTLTSKLATLRKKYKALEQRRNFDFEGFYRDIGELRKQLREMEAIAYGTLFPETVTPNNQNTDRGNTEKGVLLREEIAELRKKMLALNVQMNKPGQPQRVQPAPKPGWES
uniref:Coiled-coil domain-containing protein 77 n=1 Tax=Mucochytrium quahogii TaxID=96639 RepID=A0A7S2SHB0_9STRA|mmetsp:Transcript_43856/g.70170  ORF Transcript_43856/g.70170 Transcript_43856/m.70170 type:complete len:479 (+) Transcript_43856:178-1614(+)|eukprot:CAMPEP_0203745950 /NCGR_PEP_ID=MMETSP0098-20131031/1537_1 /ASSEMBLY_ACC=CAM_ASM_000208 /TAXON_ID=96639 /ORGANISM=" , Strain NY0313808BC1" /LENGTH=478 /DNA_ID=CAMNT_0050633879 /DNA_START=150 /DNA_END=1586 /DNA_ORIENTATION=+